jgi:plasmid stabilization system protein ParE
VIDLSPTAEAHLDGLRLHYVRKRRPEALRHLIHSVDTAKVEIALHPGGGKPSPAPYPALSRFGFRWIQIHVYWFAYEPSNPPIIAGIFHNTADIPSWF